MKLSLGDQVGQAANLLGLLLALVTLFTGEQARRLSDEREREGGPRRSRLRSVRTSSVGLAVVTTGALVLLAPLLRDVLAAIGDDDWQPVLGVFALIYVLLVALVAWQVVIVKRSG
jgi:hypothetical protein